MAKKKKRDTLSLNCVYSSRGIYVHKAHIEYIKKWHENNKKVVEEVSATIVIKPKYYARCFGHLQRITERQAMILGNLAIKL